MTKLQTTKKIATNIASFSVGITVSLLVIANAPSNKTTTKLVVKIAAFVLSGMASQFAKTYVEKEFDGLVTEIEKPSTQN
jgi:hypothetical protein